jgi:hypothetical protein
MRNFKCALGEIVDLDDPETYSYLPNTCKLLDDLMFKEIGYALVYFKYFHPDWSKMDKGKQVKRVNNLIKNFADNRLQHYDDLMWRKEQVFIFQDEIENMC